MLSVQKYGQKIKTENKPNENLNSRFSYPSEYQKNNKNKTLKKSRYSQSIIFKKLIDFKPFTYKADTKGEQKIGIYKFLLTKTTENKPTCMVELRLADKVGAGLVPTLGTLRKTTPTKNNL